MPETRGRECAGNARVEAEAASSAAAVTPLPPRPKPRHAQPRKSTAPGGARGLQIPEKGRRIKVIFGKMPMRRTPRINSLRLPLANAPLSDMGAVANANCIALTGLFRG